MDEHIITAEHLAAFGRHLIAEERSTGRAGAERLALVMEAICATGIRVSEVRYLTVEAALEDTSIAG